MTRYGHNLGYIEELYASYLADPDSVSESWRDYFADYRPAGPGPPERADPRAPSPETTTAQAEPLRGAAARIAENMADSLDLPTATSARTVAVKGLEENRHVINLHQKTVAGPKISFTHLIAWMVVRALERHPEMNAAYATIGGKPHRVSKADINLGIAIDVERRKERILLVPNLRRAQTLDAPAFVAAFDDLVTRARRNELAVEDFQETTVTLTNPGMIGTALSVPRLMPGQGAIIGTGSIGYPAEYAGMAPEVISQLGLSKVMTVTSTYDHRVIQGASSGAYLATLDRLLQGGDDSYVRLFAEVGVPREPIPWSADRNPPGLGATGDTEAIAKQAGVLQLIRAHRVRGHLRADLDPLGHRPACHPELELAHYGLSIWDLDRRFVAGGLGGVSGTLTLREILDRLNASYCGHVGIEYMHIQESEPRRWLQQRLEQAAEPTPRELQLRILKKLNAAEAFETFIGSHYVGQKRFSLEGAESLIPMLDALLGDCAEAGIEELLVGMAHRGRLNVLANLVGKPHEQIFREFEGNIDPTTTHGSGDVQYHLGAAGEHIAPDGRRLRILVVSNPSHLEAVDPVLEGLARAKQDRIGDLARTRILPLLIHGDAAFSGQGVVAETLNLSELKGYRTGGTLHIVVNNQIGFTTGPADARSSHYATDVAKMVQAPIFHVNGDRPEEAVRMARLALAYRQAFHRDVVVDLVCYRRWGHNEVDDPSYTHPKLYARIERQRSVRKLYTDQLLRRGDLDPQTTEKSLEHFREQLRQVHEAVLRAPSPQPVEARGEAEASEGAAQASPSTEVAPAALERVLAGLTRTPPTFKVHAKLARQLSQRRQRYDEGRIDWALAEALAFGSLLLENTPVRLSGEDCGRGTFSQRHAILYDSETAERWAPLQNLQPDQAPFQVFDSLLSEFAVLGFEYGYSVANPEALVLWEAQFGDFANGAQVIIDQFIASAEDKWEQRSGVVLLLPHGYEGQGPEHSSARLERFLQLSARGNLRIAVPSTPAQYFHLLRRQAKDTLRRPLVVMTPKSLLRHRACVSTTEELTRGGFRHVLDDDRRPESAAVERLLFCSGKLFYDLRAALAAAGGEGLALCRIEQIYPFAGEELAQLLAKYRGARDVLWVQEEPRNMGAWTFIHDRLQPLVGPGRALRYVGRPHSSSPATGSARQHGVEQEAIVREALAANFRPVTSAP